jgi:hypothetical protein
LSRNKFNRRYATQQIRGYRMQAINDLPKLNRRAAAKSLPIKPNKEQL